MNDSGGCLAFHRQIGKNESPVPYHLSHFEDQAVNEQNISAYYIELRVKMFVVLFLTNDKFCLVTVWFSGILFCQDTLNSVL